MTTTTVAESSAALTGAGAGAVWGSAGWVVLSATRKTTVVPSSEATTSGVPFSSWCSAALRSSAPLSAGVVMPPSWSVGATIWMPA